MSITFGTTVKYDPDNAQIYKQNAERYKAKIRQMADPLRAELEKIPADQRWLVTSEGAVSATRRATITMKLYLWPN